MKQLQGQGRPKLKKAASDQGPFHEPYQNFKNPAGPVPHQGSHNPINNARPPPRGQEQQVGPEVTGEEQ
eukprot:5876017-Prorocentrum_lima.AAC.1